MNTSAEIKEKNILQFGKKGNIIAEIELIKKFLESNILERMNQIQINMFGNNYNPNQASQLFILWNFFSISRKAPFLR